MLAQMGQQPAEQQQLQQQQQPQQHQHQRPSAPLPVGTVLLLVPAKTTPASGRTLLMPCLSRPRALLVLAQQQLQAAGVATLEQQQQQQQQQEQQRQKQELGSRTLAATGSSSGPVGAGVAMNCALQTSRIVSGSAAAAASAAESGRDGYAAAAAASRQSMSMAALLEELTPPDMSVAVDTALTGCIKQLQESAGVFSGVSLSDIPASLVVTNYAAETGDRAEQCLAPGRTAAGTAMQRDGTAADAAECSAVLQDVEGLLQLSVQPVVRQLLGTQHLQKLIRGLLSCKQQLVDTLVECARQASLRIRQR
jgi:hypothetical protein